jgi:hypothetical protein
MPELKSLPTEGVENAEGKFMRHADYREPAAKVLIPRPLAA